MNKQYRSSAECELVANASFMVARYSGLRTTIKLISLALPLRNIRCAECMRKRTMREQFLQIEDFARWVIESVAPL